MKKEDARQNILKRFQELSATLGFKRVTVDILAKKCGISKKTFYTHFKDKDEIVRCSTDSILQGIRDHITILRKSDKTPLEKLNLLFDLSFTVAANIPDVLLHDIRQYYPKMQLEIDVLLEEISQSSADSLQEGMEMELFKDIEPGFVISFIKGAAAAVLNTDCLLENNITAEIALSSFRKLVLSGLLEP